MTTELEEAVVGETAEEESEASELRIVRVSSLWEMGTTDVVLCILAPSQFCQD